MNNAARLSDVLRHGVLLLCLIFSLSGNTALAAEVRRLSFPVTLTDGQTYTVVGYLYNEHKAARKPLQVLLHGGTYTHGYWTFPSFTPENTSYVKFMSRQGYAVLALDMLGSGESSRPDGDLLDLRAAADAVHQVVTRLRTGENELGMRWNTIIGVGHSLGSATAIYAQAAYRDFDVLVSTGLGHVPHPIPLREGFHERAMNGPYFHIPPAERTEMFYALPWTSRAIVAHDNAVFDEPTSRGIYTTAMVRAFDPTYSRVGEVEGPVLVQLGDQDKLFPASFAQEEASWWTRADVTVQAVPDTGHCFNQHDSRKKGWKMLETWLKETLRGRQAAAPDVMLPEPLALQEG